MKLLWLVLLLVSTGVQASIGSITELQGSSVEIRRGNTTVKAEKLSKIESNDTVSVGSNTNLTITFADGSTARITANSKLVIDDFVYDPRGTSRSAMRVTLGTVRMASGAVARQNSQNVNIRTPTAAIAVRGTDFAMTVNELGESTIVLLPTCKDDRDITRVELPGNCTCGIIDVVSQAGSVTMDSPFYATHVATAHERPLTPVRVDPQIINAHGEGSLNKPEALAIAIAEKEQQKEIQHDNMVADEGVRTVRNNIDSKKHDSSDDTIEKALAGELGEFKTATLEQIEINPCWPFTSCGNERGYNWYEHVDEFKNNVIHVRTLESTDITTYNISVNNVDVNQRIVGSGSNTNTVTVRQWNR
jgi:hypothetical protein